MFDARIFGKNMQTKRKSANMTQLELAEKIGLTRQAISKYETGESFPDISIVIRIAEIFDTSIDELVQPDGVMALLHPERKEIFLERLMNGEIDLLTLEAALPHLENMTQLLEAAVFEGALPQDVLEMMSNYQWYKRKGIKV